MIFNKLNIFILGFVISTAGLLQQATAQSESVEAGINGTVANATNGELLANVTVKLLELNEQTQTDKEGEFSFSEINLVDKMPREITLVVDHKGFQKLSKTVQAKQSDKIRLELHPKSPIE